MKKQIAKTRELVAGFIELTLDQADKIKCMVGRDDGCARDDKDCFAREPLYIGATHYEDICRLKYYREFLAPYVPEEFEDD